MSLVLARCLYCFAIVLFCLLFTLDSQTRPDYTYTVIQIFSFTFFPVLLLSTFLRGSPLRSLLQYSIVTLMLATMPVVLRLNAQTKGIDIDDTLFACVLFFAGQLLCALGLGALCIRYSCFLDMRKLVVCRIFSILLYVVSVSFLCLPGSMAFLYGLNFATSGTLNADGIVAFFQTNVSEAKDYLMGNMVWGRGAMLASAVCLLLFVAVRCLATLKQTALGVPKRVFALRIACASFVGVLFVFCFYDNCMTKPFVEAFSVIAEYDIHKRLTQKRAVALQSLQTRDNSTPGTYVLVIGESLSRYHMSAYGYPLPTTPWLHSVRQDNKSFFFLDKAYSCHVHTVPALNYALTAKNQYNSIRMAESPSLVEMAKLVGDFQVYWISNQFPHGAVNTPITSFADQSDHCSWLQNPYWTAWDRRTISALTGLKLQQAKNLIVIHLIGSHYPYTKRYPKEKEYFGGNTDIATYDNSVRYNDDVIRELYTVASRLPGFQAFVYMADHGEDVEGGARHEASRYNEIMPAIPMWFAFSPAWLRTHPEKVVALQSHRDTPFSNDLLFDTMLGVMGITDNPYYNATNDIASPAYIHDWLDLKTMYGTRALPRSMP